MSLTTPLEDLSIPGYNDKHDDALFICEQAPDEGLHVSPDWQSKQSIGEETNEVFSINSSLISSN